MIKKISNFVSNSNKRRKKGNKKAYNEKSSGQQRRLDLHVEVQRKGDAKVVRLGEGLLTEAGPVFGDFAHLRLPVHRQHVEDHIPTEAIGEEGPRDAKHPFAISVQQTELRPPPGPVLLDGAQQAVAGGAAHLQLLD